MPDEKNWMEELKKGSSLRNGEPDPGQGALIGGSAGMPEGYFRGEFKFQVGEKVRSRIHEAEGIVEYCEFTRYISNDQISYKIRFNDPEDLKTETSAVDEQWLEKI